MNRYSYDHRKNTFLDGDGDERSPRSASRQTPGKEPHKPVKKRGLPIALVIGIDVAIAALALFIFSLFYFILPRDMGENTVALPTPTKTATVQSTANPVASPTDSSSETVTAEPTLTTDDSDFGASFPDKFIVGDAVQTANSYQSENINVSIEKVQENDVTYFIADIYIKNLECLRTAFAQDTFGYTDPTDVIADDVGAILAINGDYCTNNAGPVVRNGLMPRAETYKSDVLVLGWDGVMSTYSPEDFDLDKLQTDGAWQTWTFGPMLLENGQPMTEFNSSVNKRNPRTAVGYYAPGHYCFVLVDGRQDGYSVGMTTAELSQLFYDLGCSAAYNLDGGQSSEMVFMGDFVNEPYNGGRSTSDIVYIADIAGE
jgi:exopolysaccharide biosynthesis protein